MNHGDAVRAAGWAAGRVRLDDPWEAARPLDVKGSARAGDVIRALVARDLAGQADVGPRWDALRLLIALGAAGADDVAEALGARLVECAKLDDGPTWPRFCEHWAWPGPTARSGPWWPATQPSTPTRRTRERPVCW